MVARTTIACGRARPATALWLVPATRARPVAGVTTDNPDWPDTPSILAVTTVLPAVRPVTTPVVSRLATVVSSERHAAIYDEVRAATGGALRQ